MEGEISEGGELQQEEKKVLERGGWTKQLQPILLTRIALSRLTYSRTCECLRNLVRT